MKRDEFRHENVMDGAATPYSDLDLGAVAGPMNL